MKIALYFVLLLCLPVSFAQGQLYQKKTTLSSPPVVDLMGMTIDAADNLYLLDNSRVLKLKDGEVILELGINSEDYRAKDVVSDRILADIAVDQHQQLYLLNRAKAHIEKYDRQGKLLKKILCPQINTHHQYGWELHIDRNFNLNIFDALQRKVYVYDQNGTFLNEISLADPDTLWESARAYIAFDQDNNIYLAETKKATWNVTLYLTLQNRKGEILKRFDEDAIKRTGLMGAQGLTIAPNGDLYFHSFRAPVYVFSPTGELKEKIPAISQTYFLNAYPNSGEALISFDSVGNMYRGNYHVFGSTIYKYNAQHQLTEQIGNLRWPYEVVFDNANNLYTLDKLSTSIIKESANGKELFRLKKGATAAGLLYPLTMAVDDKNYLYVLEGGATDAMIKKYDASGNFLLTMSGIKGSFGAGTTPYDFAGLAVDPAGDLYVCGYNNFDSFLVKYDAQGKLLHTFSSSGKKKGQLWRPLDVTTDAAGNVFVLDLNGHRIQKFSSSGKLMQEFGSFTRNETDEQMRGNISSDAFGNIVTSTAFDNIGYFSDFEVRLYDLKGQLVSTLPDGTPSVAMSRDGNLIAAAANYKDIVTIYERTSPRAYNFIQGTVFNDKNGNCKQDAGEAGLPDILVKAEPGPYFGVTDATGDYILTVGKGTYMVDLLPESATGKLITATCKSGPALEGVKFESFANYATANNIGASITIAPYLTTSISSTRRRRCFESTTTLTYANTGFAAAEQAKVYLQLPDEVELLSADRPYQRRADGVYVFEVGTVPPGTTSTISIQDMVSCGDESVRGRTVCTKTWISSGNQSLAAPPTAVVTVSGACIKDQNAVRFVLKNTGKADMGAPELFRLYQDGKLSFQESFQLVAGDSLVFWMPGAGSTTYRLEAGQPEGNGDNVQASATVEACQATASAPAGFVNALPTDDEEAEKAEECLLITDSYDPNDKAVTPTGLTQQHYTPTGTTLKYKIRFQNTGTDVAYRVVVVDTLSADLDLNTLQVGAASHHYTFEVSGKGRPVLTWTFQNILLPDSTSNEAGSHGYIQFSIKPKAGLPEKTLVENFADIYFDFNSPVRTNLTANRMYDMPPVIPEENRIKVEEVLMSPTITGFTPAAGRAGTEVTITGTKFSANSSVNKVYFNGVQAQVLAANENTLRVSVPAGAGTGKLQVITPQAGTSSTSAFTFYQAPLLQSFSPSEGVAGAEVILEGNWLSPEVIEHVLLGGIACEIVSANNLTVTVKVPAGAATGPFTVHTKGGVVQSQAAFQVWYAPFLMGFDRAMQRVGGALTLQGANFAPDAGRNSVIFGTVPAQVLQASGQALLVTVPAGAQSGAVRVTTPGGTASRDFDIIPAPVLTRVYPLKGSVGTVVTLEGQNFLTLGKEDTITFGTVKAVVLSAAGNAVTVRVPRGAVTAKITVAGAGGIAASEKDFVIEQLTPQQAIQLYPNPSPAKFTLDFIHADFEVQAVQVFDAAGKQLHSETLRTGQAGQLEVDLSGREAGVYLVVIQTARGKVVKKLTLL